MGLPEEKSDDSPDIFQYENIFFCYARASTTADVLNAIAEPRRREIIGVLVDGNERSVGIVVNIVRLPQPAVPKHFRSSAEGCRADAD